MNRGRTAVASVCGIAGLAAGLLVGVGGCASYETYPAVPKNIALNDPNTIAMTDCMVASLRWVASKYPPNGESMQEAALRTEPVPFAVNLPPKTGYRTYERVVDEVGRGAVPLSEESAGLPTYHVSYVRVRGDEAQVHIIRPVASLGAGPDGKAIPQEIKLQLRGGLKRWHVIGFREWAVGVAEIPELNYYHKPAQAGKPVKSTPVETAYVPNPPANATAGKTAPAPMPTDAPATAGAPE